MKWYISDSSRKWPNALAALPVAYGTWVAPAQAADALADYSVVLTGAFALLCLTLAAGAWLLLQGKRRITRQLRDLSDCYAVLSEHSADIIWRTDAAGKVSYVSPAVQRFLGYSPEEFINLGLEALCAPSSRRTLAETFDTQACDLPVQAGGDPVLAELELIRKDGTRIWTETSRTPLCKSDCGFEGFVCVTRDIGARKRLALAVAEEQERFRTLADSHVDPLLIVDAKGVVLFANPAAGRLFGKQRDALPGTELGLPLASAGPTEIDFPRLDGPQGEGQGGAVDIFELRSAPITWKGSAARLVSLRDVTRHKEAEERLRRSEQRYRTVADHTNDCESWVGPEGEVLYASPACERVLGFSLEEFSSSWEFLAKIILREDLPLWREHLSQSLRSDHAQLDFRIRHGDGRERWLCQTTRAVYDTDGRPLGLRCNLRDITKRKDMEEQLRHQALHDPLTGIGNRLLCQDRIFQGLERAKRRDDYFYGVVFMGLDRFKLVNESLGHAFGDKLLREVSRRLVSCVRHLDTVARFGGDEFVLFLEELSSPREATLIVKRVCEALRRPYRIEGKEVQVTASLGVVLSPTDYTRPDDLLRNATVAMYHAKQAGRDRFKVFNAKMLEHAVNQLHLENDLRRGLENGEFFLVFQPIVRLLDARLLGFEALLRWQHPSKGLIPPNAFIPSAEETGLIIELGAWVLEESCRVLSRWRAELPQAGELHLSVNISGKQFSQPGLVDTVKRALLVSEIPAGALKLEITETAIMENAELAAGKLQRLKNLGVTLSIDDFGTGYSSLSYLQRFPLDNLKIDISFVRMMESAPENIEIVKAIIDLAHTLGLEVVAEGVENVLQRQVLFSLGCEYAQGFHFFRPITLTEATELVRALPPDQLPAMPEGLARTA